jgi:glyceraldehyde-3-phosphate dehydrogenase (NAD(P))
MNKPKIAVVGYGVIGRRVADAVRRQEDMELAGIAGRPASFSLRDAALRKLPVYVTEPGKPGDVADRFCTVKGTVEELVDQVDVVLDCTPSGVPANYTSLYRRRQDLVTIVQGGEDHEFGGVSFNSFANYGEVLGRRAIRVISCSSTGITRFLYTLDHFFGVRNAFVTLVRRAADPGKRSKTPINSVVPVMGESHHARDVNTVLPRLDVFSMSVDVNTTLAHVIYFHVDLVRKTSREEITRTLGEMPRIIMGEGLASTADLAEAFSGPGRSRSDRPEIYVWAEGIDLRGQTLQAAISVHMESITIPETIDCIRATLGMEQDPWNSIERTDRAMGIAKDPGCYKRGAQVAAPDS